MQKLTVALEMARDRGHATALSCRSVPVCASYASCLCRAHDSQSFTVLDQRRNSRVETRLWRQGAKKRIQSDR